MASSYFSDSESSDETAWTDSIVAPYNYEPRADDRPEDGSDDSEVSGEELSSGGEDVVYQNAR